MSMTKKELTAFVYGAACGAAWGEVTEGPLSDDFIGLPYDMGTESFGGFVSALRSKFAHRSGAYADIFNPRHLGSMETVPDVVEHIWENRSVLRPWATPVDSEGGES